MIPSVPFASPRFVYMYDVPAAPTDVYVMCIVCVCVYVDARTRSLRVFVKKPSAAAVLFCFPATVGIKQNKQEGDSDLCATSRRVTQEMGEHTEGITHVWDFSYTSRRLHSGISVFAPTQLIRLGDTCRARAARPACMWAINDCC